MHISQKSKQQIDSCRFCWMCRHICPIGNATGQERNNARARMLGLSLLCRDAAEPEELMDNVYECACCGACVKECVTGWDPVSVVKEVRLEAALENKTPAYITNLVCHVLDCGNAYGGKALDKTLSTAINAHAQKTDTLLFLGVDARYQVPVSAKNAISILEKLGISFTVLSVEPASGQQLSFLIGAAQETRQQMEDAAKEINSFKTVVFYDPADAKVLLRDAREAGIFLSVHPLTFPAFLAKTLQEKTLRPSGLEVVFQDPFQLSRELSETEDARQVISACATLREMLLNRKDTMLAGDLLMNTYMPDIIRKVALCRIDDAKRVNAKVMVTASVAEYACLRAVPQTDIQILSLEELLLMCL